MALGIDAAAHTGALDGGGRTVAVLGSALDKPYPQENEPLMRRILESGGSVVSEYAPGTPPSRYSFLQRNRIIAGMCLGHAGHGRAAAQRRAEYRDARRWKTGARCSPCPASVDSPGAQLPNMLISDGARLVTGAADILSALVIEPKDAPDSAGRCRSAEMMQPDRNAAGRRSKRRTSPAGWMKRSGRSARALLAGEADFDALCAVRRAGKRRAGRAAHRDGNGRAGHAAGRNEIRAGDADDGLKTRIKPHTNEETSCEIQIAALTDSRRAGILFDVWQLP
ncbi:MAG: DNA-processing protein DprA [Christensenellales bacterium]